jgi:hypothetical protein
MWLKIAKTFILFGGLFLVGSVVISLLFMYLFDGGNSPVMEIPFNFLLAWLTGYYGVKSLSSVPGVNKVLGSPFWQGLSLLLFGSLLGTLILYILTKQFALGSGFAITLLGGLGGRRAGGRTSRPLGTLEKIIGILFLILTGFAIFIVVGDSIVYRINDIKTEYKGTITHYQDKKFKYSFNYPSTWKITRSLLGQGHIRITSNIDSGTSVDFWYKDSGKVKNIDELMQFVEDDAKYGEKEQGVTTDSIKKTTINENEVIVWNARDRYGNYSDVYYFADFQPSTDQMISIWTVMVNTQNMGNPETESAINSILNSYVFSGKF